MTNPQNSRFFLIITLGFLAAFGPLVTDMYLPGLPAMTTFFNTTISKIQLGITTSMIGLSIGQLIIGPISDKYGRRIPLLISMWLFIASTLLCIISWDINSFVFFRLIQGLAGAGGIVLSRSISADLFVGKELAKFFAVIATVNGLAPVLGPVMGGMLLSFTNWQGIFWALLALGVILLILCYFFKETLPTERRSNSGVLQTFKLIIPILKNKSFMLYVFLVSFAMAVMFAYIASSPFIFQNIYKLTPLIYSIYFATNAIGLIAGSFLSAAFKIPQNSIKVGATGLLVMGCLTATALFFEMKFIYVCIPLFFTLLFAGMTFPSSSALAIEQERKNAGTASAVLGAMNFIIGGLITPLVGLGNILYSTAIAMVICSIIVFILMFSLSKKHI